MTATAVMMTAPVESTPFDEAAARRQEWVISGYGGDDAGLQRVELQRLDHPQPGKGTFFDDGDAWKHVAHRARQDSPLHTQALARVDPVERALIEQPAIH